MPQQTSPIELARQYADAAVFAEMRPGAANPYTCPNQMAADQRVNRLSELYASEVLGALSPQSRQEMSTLEASLNNPL